VALHLKNLFKNGELSRGATAEESLVAQIEGGREVQRTLTLYNLEAILAVGNGGDKTGAGIWGLGDGVRSSQRGGAGRLGLVAEPKGGGGPGNNQDGVPPTTFLLGGHEQSRTQEMETQVVAPLIFTQGEEYGA